MTKETIKIISYKEFEFSNDISNILLNTSFPLGHCYSNSYNIISLLKNYSIRIAYGKLQTYNYISSKKVTRQHSWNEYNGNFFDITAETNIGLNYDVLYIIYKIIDYSTFTEMLKANNNRFMPWKEVLSL